MTILNEILTQAISSASDATKRAFDKAGNMINDVVREVRDIQHLATKGYRRSDVWDAGNYLLERYSRVCSELAEKENDDNKDTLIKRAVTLSAYATIDDMLLETEDAFDKLGKKNAFSYNHEEADERFRHEWNAVYDQVLDPRRWLIGSDKQNADGKAENTSIALDEEKARTELKLTSDVLCELAENIQGHPLDYSKDSNRTLVDRDDEWGNAQSLQVAFMSSLDHDMLYEENKEERTVRPKTNNEIGADFCAWFEDIIHASKILSETAKWGKKEKNENISKTECFSVLSPETGEKIANSLADESRRCWEWIGMNILALWD